MRPMNILTEDYISLQEAYGKNEESIGKELTSLRYQIDEVIEAYDNSNHDTAAYLALRYSPIFEELTKFKYRSALANITRELLECSSLPIMKSTRYSYALCEMEGISGKNDATDSAIIFGDPKWFDIPTAINEEYNISYTKDGVRYAIKKIASIQESVIRSYDNLKSIDSNTIHDALYTLANAYTFAKEN